MTHRVIVTGKFFSIETSHASMGLAWVYAERMRAEYPGSTIEVKPIKAA